MKNLCTPMFLCWTCAITIVASPIPQLENSVDRLPHIRASLGLRSAHSISPLRIRAELGMSITDQAANPAAYHVISFDDPAYAYKRFRKPIAAKQTRDLEANGVDGSAFPSFSRTQVDLDLETPLNPSCTYHLLAQGSGSAMVTAARTAVQIQHSSVAPNSAENPPLQHQSVIGLRAVESLGAGILLLDFGPGFSPAAAVNLGNYQVTVNGRDTAVEQMGRRSYLEAYVPTGWPFPAIPAHEIFLDLGQPLSGGDQIEIVVDPSLTAGNRKTQMLFDEKHSISPSIKINQVGYRADASSKIAYLGRWLGSFPEGRKQVSNPTSSLEKRFWASLKDNAPIAQSDGGPAVYFGEEVEFELCHAESHKVALSGIGKLVHRSGDLSEGVYRFDHSGENVYHLDFSEWTTPGQYYLRVPQAGRSPAFEISNQVYKKIFEVQAYGIFAQRCGIELKPPHSAWHRIACHLNGVIPTTLARMEGEKTAHSELPSHIDYSLSRNEATPPSLLALNQDPALEAYWPLDGDLKDASGNQHTLTGHNPKTRYTAAPKIIPGENKSMGPTLGTTGNGAETSSLTFQEGQPFTFAAWVRMRGGIKFEGTLLGHADTSSNSSRVQITASWGVLRGFIGRRGEPATIGRLSDGNWHHIAMVYEPRPSKPGRILIYVDGQQRAGSEAGEGPFITDPFQVGAFTGDEAGEKYIDDVRVYKRVLKPEEIGVLAKRWGELAISLPVHGGHHDAGDYNPRSHIEVAQILMNAYEMGPRKFSDGQLNIPESNNGIPDIIDEADWAMRLWRGLQMEDGSVYGGTESNGDPNFIQSVELDLLGDYAFAPDARAAFEFAGTFAQASRIWRSLQQDAKADDCATRAERAYAWADAHIPTSLRSPAALAQWYISPKAYAAAELLHTTGKESYNQDFLETCVWSRDPVAELEKHQVYDQRAAAWAYVKCPSDIVDPEIQEHIKTAIVKRADLFIEHNSTMAYRFVRNPWAPITWGTGAYQNWLDPLLWAHTLSGKEIYRSWILQTCDNTLGANPLGRSYITGLGSRPVRAPLHNSRYSHFGEVVPGMQVQGPNQKGEGYRVPEVFYPRIREDFATLYTFADVHFAIPMNEGTVVPQARSMAVFGLMLNDAAEPTE